MQRPNPETITLSDILSTEGLSYALISNLPGGAAFVVDRHLRYLLAEGEALSVAGFKPGDLVGKTIFEVLPPDLAANYEPMYRKALAGEPFEHEHHAHNHWYISRGTPLRAENGEIYAVLAVSYDISERKQSESALHESEARFRHLVELTPHLVWNADEQGRNTYVSPQMGRYVGLPAEQLLNLDWETIIHPEDVDHVHRTWMEAVQTGIPYEAEYRLRRADGEYRWHLVRAVFEGNGQGRKWFGVSTDIHERKRVEDERKQAEVALRESEAKLAVELADARQLQFISSQLLQEENVDALYEQILEAAIALMRSEMGSMQMLHPDCNELQLLAWKGFDPASAAFWEWVRVDSESTCGMALRTGQRSIVPDVETCEGMAGSGDLDSYRRSGVRAVQTTPLICRKGRVVGMISTHWQEPHQPAERELGLLDVLARQAADLIEQRQAEAALRESEERLRLALSAGEMGTWQYRFATDEHILDPTMRQLLGLPTGTDVIPLEDFLHIVHEDDRPQVQREIERALHEGGEIDLEFRVVWQDGSVIWLKDRGKAIRGEDDRPLFLTGAATDITQRKQAEIALQESEAKYRSLFESIDAGFCTFEMVYNEAGEAIDFRYIETNPAFERQSGRRPQPGQTMRELFPEAEDMWLKDYAEVARTGQAKRFIDYHAELDRWFDVFVFPSNNGENQLAALFSDVTDEKRAESALRESEERLQKALSIETVGVLFFTLDGRITDANDTFLAMSGYSRDELRNIADWHELTPPEFWDVTSGAAEELATLGTTAPYEKQHIRQDGSRWWGLFSPTRLKGSGRNAECVEFVIDISDRKYSEAQLRRAAEMDAFRVKLADALRSLSDAAEIQRVAMRVLGEHLQVDRVMYAEIDDDGETYRIAANYVRGAYPALVGRFPTSNFGTVSEWLRAGETVAVENMTADERLSEAERAAFIAFDVYASVGVPLVKAGRWVANLGIQHGQARQWTEEDIELVRETAERTWAAVERAKAEAALRESEEAIAAELANAELLRELAARLVSEEDITTIYDEILSTTIAIARSDAGTIQIYDPKTKSLELIASKNFSRTITDYFYHVDANSRTACGIAMNTGQRTFVDFPDEVADFGCRLLVDEGFQSALALPLVSYTGTPLGMLNAHWRETRHRPTDRELRFLDLLARQAADQVEQRQAEAALRDSEQRLSVIFAQAAVGLSEISLDGRFKQVNDALCRMLGRSRQELLAATVPEVTHPEDVPKSLDALAQLPETGESISLDKRYLRPDGTVLWANSILTRLDDEQGQPYRILAVTLDVGDRKQAEANQMQLIREQAAREQERQRAETLAELDRAKTTFFSNVSHEFRTPLTLSLAPLQDALSDRAHPLDPVQRERLELVHRNSLRLLKLVNTLLDFSRIEAGRMEAVYEPMDLATYTAELASVFRSAIERAGLQLIVDCPPLPEFVFVDRQMWEKIVLNLLSNAFKFTFEGGIRVSLHSTDSNQAILQIQDTGTGIAPEHVPHLFERFYQVRGTQARTHDGSGIGLALVQELVQLHGGTIEVSSTVGEGTCFTIVLPFGTDHLPGDRQPTRTLVSTAMGTAAYVEEAERWLPTIDPLQPPLERGENLLKVPLNNEDLGGSLGAEADSTSSARVLIVDDNADMREYLTRILSEHVQVEAVADGVTALAAAQERVPDLILSDVMMPGLDGFELLEALRADPRTKEVPIILLSARAGEEAIVEGLEAGADDYLIKPFSAQELVSRVTAYLQMAQLRGEALQQERIINRQKDEFISVVSHELNTPLVSILGWTRMLRSSPPNPLVLNKALDTIERNATLQAKLVQDLLDLSRITAGKLRLHPQPIELKLVIETAIATVSQTATNKGIHLTWQEKVTEPVVVMGDSDRLQQVICNLLTNAIKFTPESGSVTLELSSVSNDGSADASYAEIRVIDTGDGIAADFLPYVFERFRQAEGAHSAKGLGLGLAIARHIVELHNGTIHAQSAGEGQGATFTVRLPLS